jgi:hypothetical protein
MTGKKQIGVDRVLNLGGNHGIKSLWDFDDNTGIVRPTRQSERELRMRLAIGLDPSLIASVGQSDLDFLTNIWPMRTSSHAAGSPPSAGCRMTG